MDILIGKVIHYYTRLGVAAVRLGADLKVGDTIVILGHTTELVQQVNSMEIEHKKVLAAAPGTDVAIKVFEPVRPGDGVYRVPEPWKEERQPFTADLR